MRNVGDRRLAVFCYLVFNISPWLVAPALVAQSEPVPPQAQVVLEFDFAVRHEGSAEIDGTLIVQSQAAERSPIIVPVTKGTATKLAIPGGAAVSLRAEIPGYWAFHEVINLRDGETSRKHTVRLWPEGTATGTLRAPKRPRQMPRELEARMEPPPFRGPSGKTPWGAVKCPIAADGRFTCRLPGDQLDLSIRVPGFAPVYFWNYSLRPGTTQSLGAVEIRPGASVTGWLELESATIQGVRVSLRRLVGADGGASSARSQAVRSGAETLVAESGFFQFRDVLPGSYVLEAAHPGFATVSLQPLVVTEGEEVLLREPLLLRVATDLELIVTPTLDWRGKPWKVELARVQSPGETKATTQSVAGLVDEAGVFRAPAQIPGLYGVTVLDSRDNPIFAEFDLPLGGEAPSTKEIRLSWIDVEGRVRCGDRPLAGVVWFGGKQGAVRLRMEADENGEFAGVLPREGVWRVEIDSIEPAGVLRTRSMVEAGPDRLAQVEIEIPAAKVAGAVRDERGAGVGGAKVTLSASRERFEAWTEDEGTFLIRGVPSGQAVLVAEKTVDGSRLTSDRVSIAIGEDEPGPVELTLSRTKKLAGIVLSEHGPVAGATVNLMAIRPKLGFGAGATSAEDGSFEAQVPGKAESLLAIVSAPGFALRAGAISADGSPVTLQVTREGGTLEASLPVGKQELTQANLDLVVLQENHALPVGMLFNWSRMHDVQFQQTERSFVVPALAAGAYRVCLAPRPALVDWDFTGFTLPSTQCAAGYLQTGSTLRLSVPGDP